MQKIQGGCRWFILNKLLFLHYFRKKKNGYSPRLPPSKSPTQRAARRQPPKVARRRAMSTGLIGLIPEEEALLVLLREAEGLTGISHDEATASPRACSMHADSSMALRLAMAPPEAEGLMDISNDQASHAAEPAEPGAQYGQQLDAQAAAVADVASRLSAAAAHVAATEEQLVAAEGRVATAVAKAEASPRLAPAPAWRPSQRVTAVVAGASAGP